MKPIMTTHPRISIEMTIITAIIVPARAPISMPDPCEVASVVRVEVVAVGDDVALTLMVPVGMTSLVGPRTGDTARVEVVAVGDDAAIVLAGVISAVSVIGVVGSGTGSGASKQTEGWINEWDWAGRQAGKYMNRWTDRRTNG